MKIVLPELPDLQPRRGLSTMIPPWASPLTARAPGCVPQPISWPGLLQGSEAQWGERVPPHPF